MKRDKIPFSHNWNGKLFCNCFTTIRLRNDEKYKIGKEYDITLKGKDGGDVVIVDIKHFHIADLNDWMALMDTGYNAVKTKEMLQTMYKYIVNDWTKQQLSFILVKRITVDISQREEPKQITYKSKPNQLTINTAGTV